MSALGWFALALIVAGYLALPLTSGPTDRGGLWARPIRRKPPRAR